MEANKGNKVTTALLLNIAAKRMVNCRTARVLPPELRVRMGFRAGMDVLENDNHPNPAGTRPWTVPVHSPRHKTNCTQTYTHTYTHKMFPKFLASYVPLVIVKIHQNSTQSKKSSSLYSFTVSYIQILASACTNY